AVSCGNIGVTELDVVRDPDGFDVLVVDLSIHQLHYMEEDGYGAVVTLASDLVAQFAIPGTALPVGVVTGVVGAPYLLWLLARGR
ncbi:MULTISPECIES: iron chelate uptake ABC transporter family permease subunit, partial [Curtobacterium]|uniref:iron chelate uptake ABC transporter family permease subunit n=1 Tax=Curtobacterium flaccumfaciens TaxID=2035 RepID=UPI003EE790F6